MRLFCRPSSWRITGFGARMIRVPSRSIRPGAHRWAQDFPTSCSQFFRIVCSGVDSVVTRRLARIRSMEEAISRGLRVFRIGLRGNPRKRSMTDRSSAESGLWRREAAMVALYSSPPTTPAILKIGRNIAMTIVPIIPPRKTIIRGSIKLVRDATVFSISTS